MAGGESMNLTIFNTPAPLPCRYCGALPVIGDESPTSLFIYCDNDAPDWHPATFTRTYVFAGLGQTYDSERADLVAFWNREYGAVPTDHQINLDMEYPSLWEQRNTMLTTIPFQASNPRVSTDRARIPVQLVATPMPGVNEITLIVRKDGTLDSTAGEVHSVRYCGELIYFDVGYPYPGQSPMVCAVKRVDTLVAFLKPEQPDLLPVA